MPVSTCSRARYAVVVLSSTFATVATVARAEEPDEPPPLSTTSARPKEQPPRTADAEEGRVAVSAGGATGKFVGLPYRSLLLDVGVRAPRRFVRWTSDAEIELGRTERGLSLYRGAVAGGIESPGRARVGIGARLSYTMVLRASVASPLGSALLGDIGGFGLGLQASVAVDIVRMKRWAIGLSARASGDVYDGGTALRLGALIDVSF